MPLVLSHISIQRFLLMGFTSCKEEFFPILAKRKNLSSQKEKGVMCNSDAKHGKEGVQ